MRKIYPQIGEERIIKSFCIISTLIEVDGVREKRWFEKSYIKQEYMFSRQHGFYYWENLEFVSKEDYNNYLEGKVL